MILNYYDPQIHMGIVKYAHEANWILDSYYHYTKIPRKYGGDGILTFLGEREDFFNLINNSSIPTVDMGWRQNRIKLPQVRVDNDAIGKMGAKYLISKGFKNVAFILTDEDPNHIHYKRFKSFKDSFSKKEFTFTQLDLRNPIPRIESLPKPLAIMAENDKTAVETQNILLRSNYKIPEEIAILGVDNDQFCRELAPIHLSSVNSNLLGNGYYAAELLNKMIDGHPPPEETIFVQPVRVEERMSTDIFAVNHRNVSKALLEIHRKYKDKISINSIAMHSGMSRPRLDDAFLKYLGHSIFDELTKVRLDHAKRLLADSDMKIEAIAYESGFSNFRHLDRSFIRVEGITPSKYRKKFKTLF